MGHEGEVTRSTSSTKRRHKTVRTQRPRTPAYLVEEMTLELDQEHTRQAPHLGTLGIETHVPPEVALAVEHVPLRFPLGVEVVPERHAFVSENQPHLRLLQRRKSTRCRRTAHAKARARRKDTKGVVYRRIRLAIPASPRDTVGLLCTTSYHTIPLWPALSRLGQEMVTTN